MEHPISLDEIRASCRRGLPDGIYKVKIYIKYNEQHAYIHIYIHTYIDLFDNDIAIKPGF